MDDTLQRPCLSSVLMFQSVIETRTTAMRVGAPFLKRSAKKFPVIGRLTFLFLCTLCLTSCNDDEGTKQDSQDAETVLRVGSASDFPAQNQITSMKVFPEDVLDSWGYITTDVAERHHAIRSKKNYGDSGEAFYARFHLAKVNGVSQNFLTMATTFPVG